MTAHFLWVMLQENVCHWLATGRNVVSIGRCSFLQQLNWPTRYKWNIDESVVKHRQKYYKISLSGKKKNDTIEEKTVITIPTFPSDKAAVKNIVKTVPQFNPEMEETGVGGWYLYRTYTWQFPILTCYRHVNKKWQWKSCFIDPILHSIWNDAVMQRKIKHREAGHHEFWQETITGLYFIP